MHSYSLSTQKRMRISVVEFIYNCMSTFLHYVHCKDALLDCSAPGGERCESLTWVDEIVIRINDDMGRLGWGLLNHLFSLLPNFSESSQHWSPIGHHRLWIYHIEAEPKRHTFLRWRYHKHFLECKYRKTSSTSRTKSQNLTVSRVVLQLSLPNPLKSGVKWNMKM